MSQELAYFPPKGSKWFWHPKALNYSPWGCDISAQIYRAENPSERFLPTGMSIYANVDLLDDGYKWTVIIRGWDGTRSDVAGTCRTGVEAIFEAERVGEQAYKELMPDWVRMPLKHGWRHP